MYTDINFKSKAALKRAIANGEEVRYYQPGFFGGGDEPTDGTIYLEGPHYPKPHTWYAKATVRDGIIVKVV